MTGFNLPPGCNVSDIPGNRPEDTKWEAIYDAFFDKDRLTKTHNGVLVTEAQWKEMDKIYLSKAKGSWEQCDAVDAYIIAALEYGYEIGRQEADESHKENEGLERMWAEEYRNPYLRQYFKALRQRASEVWIYNDPIALASVKRGLADAKLGKVSPIKKVKK